MKNLFIVFKFELLSLLNKKAFKISTLIFCIAAIVVFSIPTALNTFDSNLFNEEAKAKKKLAERKKEKFGVVINDDVDKEELRKKLSPTTVLILKSKEEINNLLDSNKITAGFIIKNTDKYEYIINDSSLIDDNKNLFDNALLELHREKKLNEKNIDAKEVEQIYNAQIDSTTTILKKDNSKNYFATYILTFGLYFIILFYGQNTATSVASEKSNRSMEILVTSTSTESLIFGKVIANAFAGIIQFGIIIIVSLLAYKANSNTLGDTLSTIFDVPSQLLINFIIFGTLGYLLYLFIFSTIGALVSRTEDINTSSMPVTLIYIVAFFTAITGLSHPSNIVIKIASYFPFTSFMAMFVRVSMSNVSIIEILISLVILLITTVLVGIFSARIYRLGTLMYGNPIKIREAFKMLKND